MRFDEKLRLQCKIVTKQKATYSKSAYFIKSLVAHCFRFHTSQAEGDAFVLKDTPTDTP